MHTDTSSIVVSHKPAWQSGMRRFSNAIKGVLAVLAVLLVSSGASTYAGDGPYVGVGGSLSILNDASVTAPAGDYPVLDADATTKNGFAVRGMAGYAFPSGLRVEAEIDYRRHKTDKMDVTSPGGLVKRTAPVVASRLGLDPRTSYADLPPQGQAAAAAAVTEATHPVKGNFSMLAFMGNVDYDFDTGSRWVPYVGGGLGVAIISIDTEDAQGRSLSDDSDTVFAYQVGAGIGYEFPLPEGRSVTVSLDWRFFGTQAPTFKGDVSGGDFDVGISGHDIGIGLIYGF